MDKFQNKYRITSARLLNYDYGSNGAYFITICTSNRINYFGEIVETMVESRLIASLRASEIGKLAQQYWMEIPNHFPFIELGNFVVMPNHVHGILIINKNVDVLKNNVANDILTKNVANDVETRLIASLPSQTESSSQMEMPSPTNCTGGFAGNKNPMFHENISRIIRWYKGRCSFEIHKIAAEFEWQSRFHDHIIRNDESFQRISNYIANNPSKWTDDKFYNKA